MMDSNFFKLNWKLKIILNIKRLSKVNIPMNLHVHIPNAHFDILYLSIQQC
jgi:hypothetical protein